MTAILTNKLRLLNARRFWEQADDVADRNLYFFIAKSMPWTDELSPDTNEDTVTQDTELRYNMLALKKVLESNLSYVIPRHDWVTGKWFVAYAADDADLYNHPTAAETALHATASSFYCLTDEMNVYKCLGVPNPYAASTVKPTGQSTSSFVTADGYTWKYMYTVSASDALKFFNNTWMPVKTLTADDGSPQWDVQQAANGGHGADAVSELGGFYVMVNVQLAYDETDFPTENNYRQLGLIADIEQFGGGIATEQTRRANRVLTLSGVVGTFDPDEEIVSDAGTPAHGYVVEYDAVGSTLRYFQTEAQSANAFAATDGITGQTNAGTATVDSVANPEVNITSGQILYKDHRRPITRETNQLEDIKITIKF